MSRLCARNLPVDARGAGGEFVIDLEQRPKDGGTAAPEFIRRRSDALRPLMSAAFALSFAAEPSDLKVNNE
ncbi:MAG: hypothetical protein R3C42_00720 [Parvularculaceae bacterium]